MATGMSQFFALRLLIVQLRSSPFNKTDTIDPLQPVGSVRGERANLKGLVLGCIEAKFCKKICVAEIYTMHSFAPFSMLKILFKNR